MYSLCTCVRITFSRLVATLCIAGFNKGTPSFVRYVYVHIPQRVNKTNSHTVCNLTTLSELCNLAGYFVFKYNRNC
jgi:hypothetical protein